MLTNIELELLAGVTGAGDTTSTTTADVKAFGTEAQVKQETRTTDNESCRRDVKAACDATSRGWFGVDRARSAQCFLDNFPGCPK